MTTEPIETIPPAPRGLSRRQVVTAGAWAAPVVLLATATPARAQVQSPGTYTGDVLLLPQTSFFAGSYRNENDASLSGITGQFDVRYAADNWSATDGNPPAALSATWTVLVERPGMAPRSASGAIAGVDATESTVSWTITGLPDANDYTVTVTVTGDDQGAYRPDPAVGVLSGVPIGATPQPGGPVNVQSGDLQVQAYNLYDKNDNPNGLGPIHWAGGQIGYWKWDGPSPAHFEVLVGITLNGQAVEGLAPDVALAKNSTIVLPDIVVAQDPAAGDTYVVTLTVIGTDSVRNSASTQPLTVS